MFDGSAMTDEELYQFGSWLYYIEEGWRDPDWWSKNHAEQYGHVLTITIEQG